MTDKKTEKKVDTAEKTEKVEKPEENDTVEKIGADGESVGGKVRFTEKHRKPAAACAFLLFIVFMLVVGYFIGRPAVRFVSEPELFRAWVDAHGIWGKAVYVGMMAFQVFVALIPGEPFEIVGGYAFGAVWGAVLCFIGSFIGSMFVFGLVRMLGSKFVEVFFSLEKINSLKFLKDSKKRDALMFAFFALPGTPKDLLCYFAGLTDIGIVEWMVICSVGRLPSIVTSTVGGSALGSKNYATAAVVFAATLAVSIAGLIVYRKVCERKKSKKDGLNAKGAKGGSV